MAVPSREAEDWALLAPSAEEAVRRRFDRHDLEVLAWLLPILFVAAVPLLVAGIDGGRPWRIGLAAANALALVAAMSLRRRLVGHRRRRAIPWPPRLLAWLGRHVRPVTMALALGQYVLLLVWGHGTEAAPAWVFSFPWLSPFLRLLGAERLLFHLVLVVAGGLEVLLAPELEDEVVGLLIGLTLANVATFGIATFATRRARRRWQGEWERSARELGERLRLRQELDAAREIQLSMLPREAPDLPWLEVASLSLPANEVGGDYFGYFPLGPDRLAVVVADVAGHGLASGLVLSGVRSGLTLLSDELDEPRRVLGRLHGMLKVAHRPRMLVALAVLVLDEAGRRGVYTSAAAPPLLLWRRATREVEEVETSSLPLGAALDDGFAERRLELGAGDVLVMSTDGVYESVDDGGVPLGLDGLARALAQAAGEGGTAAGIREALVRALWSHRGGAAQQDDVTLVVLRVGGAAAGAG